MAVSRPDYQRESGYPATQYHLLRGYTQGMKIAELAEASNRPMTCHNTDTALMTVAHLHLWAVCQSCIYPQEYYGEDSHPIRDQTPVLKTPIKMVTGHIVVPAGPGLGVEVDEEMIRQIVSGD